MPGNAVTSQVGSGIFPICAVGMTFFMGSVMLLAAAGDVRMLLRGGVLGAKRIARHLWRMRIVWAWVLTIPGAAMIGAGLYIFWGLFLLGKRS